MNAILRTNQIWSAISLRPGIFRSGLLTLVMRAFSLAAGLLISVALARTLGADGYGTYTFAFSLVALLAVPIQLGLPTLAMREVALSVERNDLGRLRGFLRWAHRTILSLSAVIGVATIGIVWAMRERLEPSMMQTLIAAAALLPLVSLSRLREAALQGVRQFGRAQIPEQVLLPTLFLACIGIAWVLLGADTHRFLPQHAMLVFALCTLVAFALGSALLARGLPSDISHTAPTMDRPTWRRALLPMALTSGFVLVSGHFSILLLGLLSTTEDVGLFRVAASSAALATFVCASLGGVVSPHVAALYSRGDRVGLQTLIRHSAWMSFLPALLTLAVVALSGKALLRSIFGAQFDAAYLSLVVLTFGQAINSATGVTHCLLNMTGHERDTLKGVMIGGATNVVLGLVLIPSSGLLGAAIASSSAIAVENLWLASSVRWRLGLDSSILGRGLR